MCAGSYWPAEKYTYRITSDKNIVCSLLKGIYIRKDRQGAKKLFGLFGKITQMFLKRVGRHIKYSYYIYHFLYFLKVTK